MSRVGFKLGSAPAPRQADNIPLNYLAALAIVQIGEFQPRGEIHQSQNSTFLAFDWQLSVEN